MQASVPVSPSDVAALKRLRKLPQVQDVCEICARDLEPDHPHLIEPQARRIACACDACALLFDGPAGKKYRRIPRDVYRFEALEIDDLAWNALEIPIGLAFFFISGATKKIVAAYPSPGGAAEAELSLAAWGEIARRHARIKGLREDIEALLVNRLRGASEAYLVPIDRCYELVGLLRKHWQGFTGGDDLWSMLTQFFAGLRERAIALGAKHAGPEL